MMLLPWWSLGAERTSGILQASSTSMPVGCRRVPLPQPDSRRPPGPQGMVPGPWHPPRHSLTTKTLQGATKNVKI